MSATPANRTDANLGEGVTDFLPLLGKKYITELLLGFLHV